MKLKINKKRFLAFVLCLLTLYIGAMHYRTTVDSLNIKKEQDKYIALMNEEKTKNETLKTESDNLNTTESYEKIARENLGLLKPGEILFVNENKQ